MSRLHLFYFGVDERTVMTGGIFLDRDGVINENRADHVKSIREYRVLPGALDAIVRLSRYYPIFVISNQPIIARGLATHDDVDAIHRYLSDWVIGHGGMITDFYYCPHAEDAKCVCRKPRAGMLFQATYDYGLSLSQSIIIGDQPSDIQAGKKAGMSTIFVRSGLGEQWLKRRNEWTCEPDMIADDLAMAADMILSLRKSLTELVV